MSDEGKALRLTLPFYPKRIINVLQTVKNANAPRSKILKSLEEKWYTRMAETYLSYCEYWDLITIRPNLCELTSFGKIILQLYESGSRNIVEALIYYSFVSSRQFSTLKIITQKIFDHLEKYGPFVFTNVDITSRFVPEFVDRHDISDLTSVFSKANILRRKKRNREIIYIVEYHAPMLTSFVLSLLHYVNSRKLTPPHNVRGFDEFRSFWFISTNQFVKYLRKCRARGWISYQEYVDINQFHFNITNLEEMTDRLIHTRVE